MTIIVFSIGGLRCQFVWYKSSVRHNTIHQYISIYLIWYQDMINDMIPVIYKRTTFQYNNESKIQYLWTANKGQDPFHQDFGSTQPWLSANNSYGVWKKLVCETFSVSVNVERGAPGFLDIPDHEGQVIFPTKAHLWNIWDLRRPLEWNISLIFKRD